MHIRLTPLLAALSTLLTAASTISVSCEAECFNYIAVRDARLYDCGSERYILLPHGRACLWKTDAFIKSYNECLKASCESEQETAVNSGLSTAPPSRASTTCDVVPTPTTAGFSSSTRIRFTMAKRNPTIITLYKGRAASSSTRSRTTSAAQTDPASVGHGMRHKSSGSMYRPQAKGYLEVLEDEKDDLEAGRSVAIAILVHAWVLIAGLMLFWGPVPLFL